jgi:hypothetical protein
MFWALPTKDSIQDCRTAYKTAGQHTGQHTGLQEGPFHQRVPVPCCSCSIGSAEAPAAHTSGARSSLIDAAMHSDVCTAQQHCVCTLVMLRLVYICCLKPPSGGIAKCADILSCCAVSCCRAVCWSVMLYSVHYVSWHAVCCCSGLQ